MLKRNETIMVRSGFKPESHVVMTAVNPRPLDILSVREFSIAEA